MDRIFETFFTTNRTAWAWVWRFAARSSSPWGKLSFAPEVAMARFPHVLPCNSNGERIESRRRRCGSAVQAQRDDHGIPTNAIVFIVDDDP